MKSPIRRSAWLAALALLIAGCGGGDDDVPGVPNRSVNLQGTVIDGPIAGATVTATVGSRSFTTSANGAGAYTLAIDVPPTDGGLLVMLVATGTAGQSFVKLTGIAGTVDTLIAAAGTDGIVQPAEAGGVDITQLSTANLALAQEVLGAQPTSLQAVEAALDQVDPLLTIRVAAALKLLIDEPATYPLPAGNADTWAFALDAAARERFIETTATGAHAADFEQAQEASAALAPATPFAAGRLYLIPGNSLRYALPGTATIIDLQADHSGRFTDREGSAAIAWQVDGNALRMTLAQPRVTQTHTTEFDPETFATIDVERTDTVTRFDLRRVVGRTTQLTAVGTSHTTRTNQQTGEVIQSDEPIADSSYLARIDDADFETIDPATLDRLALAIFEPAQPAGGVIANYYRVASDELVFVAGGTGTTRLRDRDFTWTQPADRRALIVTVDNGTTATYRRVRTLEPRVFLQIAEFQLAAGGRVAAADMALRTQAGATRSAAQLPGPGYFLNGIGREDDAYDPRHLIKDFWLQFSADHTGAQCNQDFVRDNFQGPIVRNEDGSPQVESFCSSLRFQWQTDGTMVLGERTYDPEANEFNCPVGAPGCRVFDRRQTFWLGSAPVDGRERLYVLQVRQFADDITVGIDESTPVEYTTRFYDLDAPPTAAKAMLNPEWRK